MQHHGSLSLPLLQREYHCVWPRRNIAVQLHDHARANSRLMMTRMISLVPSRMLCTLRSRT